MIQMNESILIVLVFADDVDIVYIVCSNLVISNT